MWTETKSNYLCLCHLLWLFYCKKIKRTATITRYTFQHCAEWMSVFRRRLHPMVFNSYNQTFHFLVCFFFFEKKKNSVNLWLIKINDLPRLQNWIEMEVEELWFSCTEHLLTRSWCCENWFYSFDFATLVDFHYTGDIMTKLKMESISASSI